MCLGMTHEEVFTSIARNEIRSYKQLPQVLVSDSDKFRDEPRPKSGLMRLRTFIMKDAYPLTWIAKDSTVRSPISARPTTHLHALRDSVFDRRGFVGRNGWLRIKRIRREDRCRRRSYRELC